MTQLLSGEIDFIAQVSATRTWRASRPTPARS